jgi:hypothetical protein
VLQLLQPSTGSKKENEEKKGVSCKEVLVYRSSLYKYGSTAPVMMSSCKPREVLGAVRVEMRNDH